MNSPPGVSEQSHTTVKSLNYNNTNCTEQKQCEKWEMPGKDYFTHAGLNNDFSAWTS